jgi:hypothetical protein
MAFQILDLGEFLGLGGWSLGSEELGVWRLRFGGWQ